jgi:GntR family transcriptional regulator / MocR family aminotransferase
MAEGRLAGGERLPASRALAAELGVSRNVVNGAYAQLFAEGWIEGRQGSGTYVADGAPSAPAARTPPATAAPATAADPPAGRYSPADPARSATMIDLRPGIPWTAGIDQAAWRRAWRTAGLQPPAAPHRPGFPNSAPR